MLLFLFAYDVLIRSISSDFKNAVRFVESQKQNLKNWKIEYNKLKLSLCFFYDYFWLCIYACSKFQVEAKAVSVNMWWLILLYKCYN